MRFINNPRRIFIRESDMTIEQTLGITIGAIVAPFFAFGVRKMARAVEAKIWKHRAVSQPLRKELPGWIPFVVVVTAIVFMTWVYGA